MRTSHLPMRMSWLGLISCVILALLLVAPSTAPATTIYVATLTGANEVGPTGSPATGFSTVTLNGNTLTVDETFSGLIGLQDWPGPRRAGIFSSSKPRA